MNDEQLYEYIEEQLSNIGECEPDDVLLIAKPDGVSDERFDRIASQHGLKPKRKYGLREKHNSRSAKGGQHEQR